MSVAVVLLAFPLGLLVGFALIYNALVQGRNHCDEAWADIDAELKSPLRSDSESGGRRTGLRQA